MAEARRRTEAHGKRYRKPWLFPKEGEHEWAGGFPNGNYWTRQDNGGTNAYILNGDSNGLNYNNGNNDDQSNPNQVVCVP